ncbi:TetR family transcriptional regulator [Novosphingobium aquimarinum]|uniref:TetR family transcriptional regulator n=1 Tax=Novosphingobium aquimarinum TaxID=2682494 RepID=UPI0012EBA008|nr:TetR family transcriptional regulator [Novosphingobium aquimarinum]
MSKPVALPFIPVARSRIADHGIRGLSMRTVAQGAGSSVGSLNHHIGDKAALIGRLIEEERKERRDLLDRWRKRTAQLALADPQVLASVIAAYLEEAAVARREASVTICEFLVEAIVDPHGFPTLPGLLDDEDHFWAVLLERDHGHSADALGRAIAAYCRDELPFFIAAPGHTDFRLLRTATIQRLAEGMVGQASGLSRGFAALVSACGEGNAAVQFPFDLPEGSKRVEVAGYAANVMMQMGAAGITHRQVASEGGIPHTSVAHYFPTREDLMHAAIGSLILRTRHEVRGTSLDDTDGSYGLTLIRATHSVALAATRDPALVVFALDMRRRRAENVHGDVSKTIGGSEGLDRAAAQTATMILIGSGLAAMARGGAGGDKVIRPKDLMHLRAACLIGSNSLAARGARPER